MAMMTKVKPEEVGVSSARLATVNQLLHRYIKMGLIPGAVVVIAREGKLVVFNAYGKMDLEQDKPMREETLFRLDSMTRPLTAVALLILYEQGLFQLSDPVSHFIPAFKNLKVLEDKNLVNPKREITIHDLFVHTAGISHPSLKPATQILLKEWIQQVPEYPLVFHPGIYHEESLSYHVLAYLVEYFSGMAFDEWIAKKITAPLNLFDTSFYVPKHKMSRLATLYEWNDNKLHKKQDDEDLLTRPTFFSGDKGLVSTATDYLRFCQLLLNQGELDEHRLLGRKTIELMITSHLSIGAHTYIGRGLGVNVTLDPAQAQFLGTKGDYFWNSAMQTSFFNDPQEKLSALCFTQVKSTRAWDVLSQAFRTTVYQALIQ